MLVMLKKLINEQNITCEVNNGLCFGVMFGNGKEIFLTYETYITYSVTQLRTFRFY